MLDPDVDERKSDSEGSDQKNSLDDTGEIKTGNPRIAIKKMGSFESDSSSTDEKQPKMPYAIVRPTAMKDNELAVIKEEKDDVLSKIDSEKLKLESEHADEPT